MESLHIALGFESAPADNWQHVMPPPRKPGNWKDSTYQEKLPEMLAAQAAEVVNLPIVGRVTEVWAYDVMQATEPVKIREATAGALLVWCNQLAGNKDRPVVFYGVGLRKQLRKLAAQSADSGPAAAALLVDSKTTPAKIDLLTYMGVSSFVDSAQQLAQALTGVDYPKEALGEAAAVARVVRALGLPYATDTDFAAFGW